MNNRYICRGKRKDNDEWVEGVAIFADNKAFILNNAKVEFIKGFNENRLNFVLVEVIPETVGQCANLKDKNGKLIYEGDLLRFTNSDNEQSIYKVFYDDVYAGYRIQEIDLGGLDEMSNWEDSREYFEVIGNIHDNPELLEV